jgi:hypothetical protein
VEAKHRNLNLKIFTKNTVRDVRNETNAKNVVGSEGMDTTLADHFSHADMHNQPFADRIIIEYFEAMNGLYGNIEHNQSHAS